MGLGACARSNRGHAPKPRPLIERVMCAQKSQGLRLHERMVAVSDDRVTSDCVCTTCALRDVFIKVAFSCGGKIVTWVMFG